MEHIFSLASKYLREHKQHRRYLSIFLCLALLIAAATVALLTREGVAMTKTVSVLSCPFSGVAAHTHNADCYDADGNLVCPLPERALHEHDDSCYTEETVLICGREDTPGHVHTEA